MEKYKISYYTTINTTEYGLILFNTYSCGLIKIEEKEIKNLDSLSEEIVYKLAENNPTYRNILINNGFLIKNYINEFNLIKANYYLKKYQNTTATITINTGLICNCSCQYCYEGQIHSDTSFLTKEVAVDIVSFLKKQFSQYIKLNISFIGGEPLICLEQIKYIYFELKESFKNINLSILTNGLLLNKENALFLKKSINENIQISIDGTKQYHDKKRIAKNGISTYDILISNIKILQDLEIPINIRTHIDHEFIENININDWIESIKTNFDINKNISFYLTPIVYTGKGKKIFNKKYMGYILNVYTIFIKNKIPILFDFMFKPASFCSVDTLNGFSIDSKGTIYKCWHDLTGINFNNHQFGDIYNGIDFPKIINYINEFDVIENNECKKCKYLPLCYGGCPEYIHAGYNKCIPLKHYHNQLLSLFMNYKGYIL
jgi:uncharacterized protein